MTTTQITRNQVLAILDTYEGMMSHMKWEDTVQLRSEWTKWKMVLATMPEGA